MIDNFQCFPSLNLHYNIFQVLYVYDATLGIHPYDGGPATLTNILMGKRTVGDVYLRRFKTCDIPKDDEGAQNFLMNVYKEKDELLGQYKESEGKSFTKDDVAIHKVNVTRSLNFGIVKY